MQTIDELGFLSNVALRLAEEITAEDDVFRLIAEEVARIVPDGVVCTSQFVAAGQSTIVKAIAGSPEVLAALQALLGDVTGSIFQINDNARRGLSEGRLKRLSGLRELVFESWPDEVARSIETRLQVRSVHAQAFARKGDFLGTVAVISRATSLPHKRLIESLVPLAAVVVQRLRAEARARDTEQILRMLADHSPDVIFRLQLTPTTKFVYVSPASTELVGRSPEELYADASLGAGVLYPAELPVTRQVSSEPLEVRHPRPPESCRWTEHVLTAVRDGYGNVVAVEGIVRDITARKRAEEAMLEADRRKTSFLAMLSHELRNPLAPIRNSLQVLDRAPASSEQATRARAVIGRQTAHLTQLLDDLLDLTRITRGKIQLRKHPIELGQLMRTVIEDHQSLFARGEIDLEMSIASEEIWIDADPTRIAQVVGNLLGNAAKFTLAGGRVWVATRVEGAQAIVEVSDTGVGIEPDLLPHLFEPFVQSDTTLDRSKGGLGLGLMLAKGLVELHGGSIAAASEGIGRGTRVTFRLPRVAPRSRSTQPPAVVPDRARVLLIEDNADAAETLRDLLELEGHTVELASSGPDGIARACDFHPEVVLCDIGLPGMDGFEVARRLRRIPELGRIGLIALTGYASSEDAAKARAAGFDHHLAKPASVEQLRRAITDLRPLAH